MHLLVVDANSPDGTGKVVRGKMKKYDKLHLLALKEKGGLGADYVAGFKYAMKKLYVPERANKSITIYL